MSGPVQVSALTAWSATATVSVTLTGVTAGNGILVLVGYNDGSNNTSGPHQVADSVSGANLTPDSQGTLSHNSFSIYSFLNVAAGSHTVTATMGTSAIAADIFGNIQIMEVALATSGALDPLGHTSNQGNSVGPVEPTASGTLAAINEFTVAGFAVNLNTLTGIVLPSGYTATATFTTQFPAGIYCYQVATTTAPLQPNFGTLSSASVWAVAQATYTMQGGTGIPLSINAVTGVLTGTLETIGTQSVEVTVTDSVGATATKTFSLPVSGAGVLTITTASLANAVVGQPYSQALAATGGSGTGYTFTILSAEPNDGLWLWSDGQSLLGTPQMVEAPLVTIQVVDSIGNLSTPVALQLNVTNVGALAFVTASLPSATVGSYYSAPVLMQGGVPPYTHIPVTLSQPWVQNLGGWVMGSPSTTGTISFTDTVTDVFGTSISKSFSIPVTASTFKFAGIEPISGVVRLPSPLLVHKFKYTLQTFGGTGIGITYAITAGTLPPGLILSSSGVITGSATQIGTYNFTVHATDSASNSATASFTQNVINAIIVARPSYNATVSNGLFVLNGKLYDKNGNYLRMRGIDRNHYDSADWTGGVAGAQANIGIVRVFLELVNQTPAFNNTHMTNQYIANDVLAVATCSASEAAFTGSISGTTLTVTAVSRGPIVVSNQENGNGQQMFGTGIAFDSVHNCNSCILAQLTGISGSTGTYQVGVSQTLASTAITSNGPTSGNADVNSIVNATNQFVTQVAGWASLYPNIIINIANEWGVGPNQGFNPFNTEATWQSTYITAVAAIRAAGFTGPFLIDTLTFGEDFTCVSGGYAAAILAADPLKNIIFSFHLYGSNMTLANVRSATKANPCIITLDTNSSSPTHPFSSGFPGNSFQGSVPYTVFGAQGMPQLNGTQAASNNSVGGVAGAWTIQLSADSTSWGTYTGGGQIVDPGYYTVRLSTLQGFIQTGICCLVGEFGPSNLNGTTVDLSRFISACEAYQVSWAYWAWDDNNSGGAQVTWSGWFGMTGPTGTTYTDGQYNPRDPTCLSQPGLEVELHPRTGLQTLATYAPQFLP